jgi:cytoskeletal protein CcmA (bactofilin family)
VLGRDSKKATAEQGSQTLISPNAQVHGDVVFNGGLHVQGKVVGNISAGDEGGRLVIGSTGDVEGEINVPKVIINGRVKGDVHAGEHLELAEKAVIEGNVYYTMIEMVMGARVNGKLVRRDEGEPRNLPGPNGLEKDKTATASDEAEEG